MCIKVVQKSNEGEKFDGYSSDIILVKEFSGESKKHKKNYGDNFFADIVLGKLSREINGTSSCTSMLIWQILLSFLSGEGCRALVSLSNSNGDTVLGILEPFTAHSALVSIVNSDCLDDRDCSSSNLDRIHYGIDNSCVQTSNSHGFVSSQTEASTPGDCDPLGAGMKKKNKKHSHQDLTWSSFCKAASECSDFDLAAICFSRKSNRRKKPKFLKCWLKQIRRHCQHYLLESMCPSTQRNHPNHPVFWSKQSLKQEDVTLAERIVKPSIHWLLQSSEKSENKELQNPFPVDDSCKSVLLRMEIIRSDIATSMDKPPKQKLLKQIYSLLDIVHYLIGIGIHGNFSLRLEDNTYEQRENVDESPEGIRKEELARKSREARERRQRAQRFVSFTSRMPDLQRVWAPKLLKGDEGRSDSLHKDSKRKDRWRASYSVVCGTPMTAAKRPCSRQISEGDDECKDPGNFSYSACSAFSDLRVGLRIHSQVLRVALDANLYVGNGPIAMYGKCGEMESFGIKPNDGTMASLLPAVTNASRMLCSLRIELVPWNVMIAMYVNNSMPNKAVEVYEAIDKMHFRVVVSWTSMISAYGKSGQGRAGRVCEAHDFIKKMPMEPNETVLGSFLSACPVHNNIDIALEAADHLLQLAPKLSSYYVLSSNIYAKIGRWKEVTSIRSIMKGIGIKKLAGIGNVELNNQEAGYVPETDGALHDVEDEDNHLLVHIEKLAIVIAIINAKPGTQIRVTKIYVSDGIATLPPILDPRLLIVKSL
ncbi:hypothetical protein ACH5RR_017203 [Cinchona calisaya]|uniref:DYW domain-containing protein n=1 Tax=Cinchona calisaya TaxID=153742 RepID=A0ABD2ZY36_9GENT